MCASACFYACYNFINLIIKLQKKIVLVVVDPTMLEGPHAVRKRDLAARLASQREGQMGRDDKVPGRKAGMSNREKEKRTKNFMMISKKRKVLLKQKQAMSLVKFKQKKHRATLKKNSKQISKIRSRRKQGR